ncbi:MAG: hypothetical protein AB4352_18125 [Hormoscilla sp.]
MTQKCIECRVGTAHQRQETGLVRYNRSIFPRLTSHNKPTNTEEMAIARRSSSIAIEAIIRLVEQC